MNIDRRIEPTQQQISGLAQMVAGSTRLWLLKAIEDSVSTLASEQHFVTAISVAARTLTETISAETYATPFDADGTCREIFETGEDAIKQLNDYNAQKRDAAIADPELRGDHETSIADEYTRLIDCYVEFFHAVQDLRWAVMEHDADLEEPTGKVYTDVDELIADLNA